jgi:hypothetical protein
MHQKVLHFEQNHNNMTFNICSAHLSGFGFALPSPPWRIRLPFPAIHRANSLT